MSDEQAPPGTDDREGFSAPVLTNSERFLEAFAHVPHKLCGRWLEPFSLRHRFWLETFESPLVTGGEATLLDLEMAAKVCSMRFEDLEEGVPRMLLRGPTLRDRARFSLRALAGDAARHYAVWQDYLTDHGCPPATHGGGRISKGGKRYVALPEILGLVTALARGSGWEPETIWRLSPGAAEWYLTGIFMHRGVDMKVKTSHDEEFEAGMRAEMEAKRKAEAEKAEEFGGETVTPG